MITDLNGEVDYLLSGSIVLTFASLLVSSVLLFKIGYNRYSINDKETSNTKAYLFMTASFFLFLEILNRIFISFKFSRAGDPVIYSSIVILGLSVYFTYKSF